MQTVVHVQETGPRPLTFLKLWRRLNAWNRHELNEKLKSKWLRKRRNDTRTPAKPIILIVLLKFIDCDYDFHSTDQRKFRLETPCSSAVTESQHDSEIKRIPHFVGLTAPSAVQRLSPLMLNVVKCVTLFRHTKRFWLVMKHSEFLSSIHLFIYLFKCLCVHSCTRNYPPWTPKPVGNFGTSGV